MRSDHAHIKLADLKSLLRKPGPGTILQPPQQYSHPNAQSDPARERQKLDLQKNKSKKPTDRDLPEGIESLVIGDVAERYRKLREIEKRLDSTMMRKRLDLQDQTTQNSKRPRTMRIWISNTAENQPWQNTSMDPDAFDFGDTSQASYRVKIEGRLLDEEDSLDEVEKKDGTATAVADGGEPMDTDAAKPNQPKPSSTSAPVRSKLSHFFKQITIEFDRPATLQPDGMAMIEWKRPETRGSVTNWSADGSNFDCLHFERKSDENINIKINLYRDESPERFRLSPDLAELCGGIAEGDRAGVMLNVWKYIRANKLYENEDARVVRCDHLMKKIFRMDAIQFNYVLDYVIPHLQPLPPITLHYTIRVDSAYINATPKPSPYTIYDVSLLEDDPMRKVVADTLIHSNSTIETLTTLSKLDENIAVVVQAITQSKAKHAFYEAMAKDPVAFLKRWISSQKRDLEVIMGESSRGLASQDDGGLGDEWRRGGEGGVWNDAVAKESVSLFLARKHPG
ncbi:hypothetical protein EG328_003431 [Venturia inaequalis]|uniref:DM2 domain-containing protein n=1 Tax=Venturia inaequalis TaxID=5025 RepID=A0A8H3VNT1_VENIN|nr:hypothetical protein EG328_003431 [Venturia inaequalis]KAE9990169.1 hypothetical protein EG327_001809 [Venturia inaequalis]RDI89555.1 hypothetical protein Vi05172_g126 [Venturia inaequalis]